MRALRNRLSPLLLLLPPQLSQAFQEIEERSVRGRGRAPGRGPRRAIERETVRIRKLELRALVYRLAAGYRGRGRIPKVLLEEAIFLNRMERRLAILRRPPVDPRQQRFGFLTNLPECPAWRDWRDLLKRERGREVRWARRISTPGEDGFSI